MTRQIVFGAALALSSLCAASGSARAERVWSPQRFAFELKFGPYLPAIDQSAGLNGRTPFSDQFGAPDSKAGEAPSRGLLTQGEFDYQFFHKFGVLGVGLSAGYYQIKAPAFASLGPPPGGACQVAPDNDGYRDYRGPDATGKQQSLGYDACISGDEISLRVVPIALLAIYRFDVLSKRYRIPVIPYAKAGLAYYFWWFGSSGSYVSEITVGSGDKASTRKTAGGTFGFVLQPGIAIDLSAIDTAAAYAIDQEIGLNRFTLFVEFNGAFINAFGSSGVLNLSDKSFNAGLSFEF
jgi:hypothetical protein